MTKIILDNGDTYEVGQEVEFSNPKGSDWMVATLEPRNLMYLCENQDRVRHIAPPKMRPMTCLQMQQFQDQNPTIWFKSFDDSKQYKITERCNDRVRFGDNWRKPELIKYTLDYGQTWQKCEVAE